MRWHVRGTFLRWYNVELFAILPWHSPTHDTETPDVWRELEPSRLLCVPAPPIFTYYSGYILKHHPRQDFVWSIATLKFVI